MAKTTIQKINGALPGRALSAIMIAMGSGLILLAIFSKSNILKATVITYGLVP